MYQAIQLSRKMKMPLSTGSILDMDIDLINQFIECLEIEKEYGTPKQNEQNQGTMG